ncbi:MAG TPA: rhodanese-related sulfurtransferase [Chlamydiales bacterium]
MDYQVLAYYILTPIEAPHEEVRRHQEFFKTRDLKSRIYISEQGINGQMSGSAAHAEEYMQWIQSDARFSTISFKIHPSTEHAFPKATIKYRRQLVAMDCDVDLSRRGEHVTPEEWKSMLEQKDEETIVLDVRNDYEWKIGHFDGAELPPLETFRQFPAYAKQLQETRDPKKTKVMMYCTGGIRCEFYSAALKQEGFEQVYQLEGGVIQYGQDEGQAHWKGKLFVFDDRLVVPLSHEEVEPISECQYCHKSVDAYTNCANMDCNALFIVCPDCAKSHKGCCSDRCLTTGRVRPMNENAPHKPFRKCSFEEKQALAQPAKISP